MHPEKKVNLSVLWGGGDFDPSWYGHTRDRECGVSNLYHDHSQLTQIDEAIKKEIPIIGICKGAQALCIHQGGWLYQHVPPQNGLKRISLSPPYNFEKSFLMIPKSHHQVCNVFETGGEVLAYSEIETKFGPVIIPEIVWYPKIKAIGIQGHPEYFECPEETDLFLFDLIKQKLGVELNNWKL